MKNSRVSLPLLLLALLCLSLPACKHASTLQLDEPTIKPQPPLVRCKKPATAPTPTAPRRNEWVVNGTLSERAAVWIAEVLGLLDEERGLRKVEHQCLDDSEKKGYITQ